jgi:hypothetical protein
MSMQSGTRLGTSARGLTLSIDTGMLGEAISTLLKSGVLRRAAMAHRT